MADEVAAVLGVASHDDAVDQRKISTLIELCKELLLQTKPRFRVHAVELDVARRLNSFFFLGHSPIESAYIIKLCEVVVAQADVNLQTSIREESQSSGI